MDTAQRLPRVDFRYSSMLDKLQKEASPPSIQATYPEPGEVKSYMREVESIWRMREKEIFGAIEDITGLPWNDHTITAYVKGRGRCFADPLNLSMFRERDEFVDVLTHELIHKIKMQNPNRRKQWRSYLPNRWPNEGPVTAVHVLVHAIHKELYLTLFDGSRLERNIRRSKRVPGYSRSWEIVGELGHKDVIAEFRKVVGID